MTNIKKNKFKNPYLISEDEKKQFFKRLKYLTYYHKKNNSKYSKILNLSKKVEYKNEPCKPPMYSKTNPRVNFYLSES